MKYDAVILLPMRKGSVEISRKNLRRVTETESLASRAILRAVDLADAAYMTLDLICKVVVMTDDPAIVGLAEAHDVAVFVRDPTLASAAATLQDAVFEFKETSGLGCRLAEITVVMQATSPWLELSHCLEALELVAEKQADSATTVTHSQHLTWDGRGNPLFEERVNRQLESDALWEETGGIHVVSGFPRFDGLDPKAWMIGGTHSLIPVSGSSSIDIDSPTDLLLARQVWEAGRILYVCLGDTAKWGSGHTYRARLIAEELELKNSVTVWCPDVDAAPDNVKRWQPESFVHSESVGEYNCVIVDMLDTGAEWIEAAENMGVRCVAFETSHPAEFVINEMLPEGSGHLTGPMIATIGPEFYGFPRTDTDNLRRILVCLGAGDVRGWEAKIVHQLEDYKWRAEGEWEIVSSGDIDRSQIAYELWRADVAVLGRGRMTYEAAYLGTPFVSLAQNDRELTHVQLDGGVYLENASFETIASAAMMDVGDIAKRAKVLRAQVDGGGVARICQIVESMTLKVGRQ